MISQKRIARSTRRSSNTMGAATVELAIVLPVLMIFALGTIDAGQFANVNQIVSTASREGARVAARNATDDVAHGNRTSLDN